MAEDRLKILIVDDNRDFCDSLKDVLEIEGYDVLTAYDGLSALETVKSEPVKFIFMDLVMPVMDGLLQSRNLEKAAQLFR